MNQTVFHLGLKREQLSGIEFALLPGDPGRVPKIAQYLENPTELAWQREFRSQRGRIHGHELLICSTGIGGPSTAICVEELAMLGITRFLRVGTTGALQESINTGDVIIPTAAVRLDGTSRHLAPIEYPAVADFALVRKLVENVERRAFPHHIGVCASSDTFYQGQNRRDSFQKGYLHRLMQGQLEEMKALKVLSFEMEVATLFTQCSSYGLSAAAVLGVLVNRNRAEFPSPAEHAAIEDRVIQAALSIFDPIPPMHHGRP